MNNVAEFAVATPRRSIVQARQPRQRPLRCHDDRWPALAAALAALRAAHRSSVRIVDADCGAGSLLLCAVRHARALGFTAIEARGIDQTAALVARARAAADTLHDPAIGISFESADLACALGDESEFPADIVIWHGCAGCSTAGAEAVVHAGRTLIADPANGGDQ